MSDEQTTAPGTALAILEQPTGQLVAEEAVAELVKSGTDQEVVEFVDALDEVAAQIAEWKDAALGGLRGRCDRRLEWTARIGEPKALGYQWELKVPSPSAGGGDTDYDADAVDTVLAKLQAAGIIDQTGADKVLKRTVTATYVVSTADEVAELVDELDRDPRVDKAKPERRVIPAGIAALKRLPAGAEALREAERPKAAPARPVSITRVEKKR